MSEKSSTLSTLSPPPNEPLDVEIRSLKETELEIWFDHLDTVFETTPRNYFVNHWNSDPLRDIEGIRVAIDKKNGKIVSTVRVFIREIYIQGKSVSLGGIGEVSTKKEMQGKGLAKILLRDAIQWMKSKKIILSSLHTGSAMPLYASVGWNSVPRVFIYKPFSFFASQTIFSEVFQIRKPDFSDSKEVSDLMEIYTSYAIQFNGILVRSHVDYWRKWIPNELNQESFIMLDTLSNKIVAFLSFGPEKRDVSLLIIKDFFVDKSFFEKDRGKSIFHQFLSQALQNASFDKSNFSHVAYPAACFHEENETVESRPGLMYCIIDETFTTKEQLSALFNESPKENLTKHLSWDIDKF